MDTSFKELDKVPDKLLEDRLDVVQTLETLETEAYEIVKDKLTGEHYLHYYYLQINISGGGEKEVYNHLLPLDSDDVIGFIFEKTGYQYPENWKKSYLRNGPEGQYIWFDPTHAEEYDKSVQISKAINEKLALFKKEGNFDEEAMKKFMDEIDQLKKDLGDE